MMTVIPTAIERGYAAIARFFFRRPVFGLLLLALSAALSLSQARLLTRDGSIEGFFQPGAPEIASYDTLRRHFGQDGQIIVGVQSDTLFTAHNLTRLAELHRQLSRDVPFVEDITSLVNARQVVGGEGMFVVNDMLDHFLAQGDLSQPALDRFRAEVMAHPVYRDLLMSRDGEMTLITLRPQRFSPEAGLPKGQGGSPFDGIGAAPTDRTEGKTFLSQAQLGQMAGAVAKIVAGFQESDFRVAVAGSPVAASEIVRILSSDMPRLTLLCLIAMFVVVTAVTRRVSAGVAMALTVAVSTLATFGIMAMSGVALKPPTQILPPMIIVGAACTVMHLVEALTHARRHVTGATERDAREAAIGLAARHAAVPIVFATVTTAVGLMAFAGSPMLPLSDLGLFGALSSVIVLIVATVTMSVFFRLFRFRPAADEGDDTPALRLGKRLALWSAAHHRLTLTVAGALLVLSAAGLFGLNFSHNSLKWLPADNQVRRDTETIDARMNGSVNLEAVIDTGAPRGIQNQRLLEEIDRIAADIPAMAERHGFTVGKVFGVTDLLKEVNHALDPSEDGRSLPKGPMIAREFLLFENSASNDLPELVDRKYSRTRITIRVPWLEAGVYAGFIKDLRADLETRLTPLGMTDLSLTGNMALLAQTSVNVIDSMRDSYVLSVAMIGGLMLIAIGSLKLGFAALVPNLVPLVISLGVMGFAGVPLDSFTMLADCVALGLIVDDTTHFFHQLRQARRDGLDGMEAVGRATEHSFMPILGTSIAVLVGFSAYALSTMSNVVAFGLITAGVGVLGLLADIFLSPAIFMAMCAARRQAPPMPNPPRLAASPSADLATTG